MRRTRSRNVLFLSEMVMALTIFVLCAAVCMAVLWRAHGISEQSAALNQAVFAAQNAAEAFQTTQDMAQLAELLEGEVAADGSLRIYYDADWQTVATAQAVYSLALSAVKEQDAVLQAELVVASPTGEPIYELSTAVYRQTDAQPGGEG